MGTLFINQSVSGDLPPTMGREQKLIRPPPLRFQCCRGLQLRSCSNDASNIEVWGAGGGGLTFSSIYRIRLRFSRNGVLVYLRPGARCRSARGIAATTCRGVWAHACRGAARREGHAAPDRPHRQGQGFVIQRMIVASPHRCSRGLALSSTVFSPRRTCAG